jgi:hypothetical protein
MVNAKLFISFTGTMYALKSGRVTGEDLDNGLFVFGCTRGHAITPGASHEHIEEIVTQCPALHQQLVAALTQAEIDGRVRWRTLEERVPSFEMVDDLLTSNGRKPLMSEDEYYSKCPSMGRGYCYPAVRERSTELVVIG